MEELCLMAITRVDKDVFSGCIDRRRGLLFFHSEAERLEWVRSIAVYREDEQKELAKVMGKADAA